MDVRKEAPVTAIDAAVETAKDTSQSKPTTANASAHWATPTAGKPELEQKFEAMRARNWITDRMVQQYQKHWHCSRETALERLLSKASI